MKKLILVVLVLGAFAAGRDNPSIDPRLKEIHSLFVSGNNQAAESVRNEIAKDAQKGKGCFTQVTNEHDADAVLALNGDSTPDGTILATRDWIVSGLLTMKSGDQVWSHSERFSDAPFMSGGKTAGKLLYIRLRREACGR